MVLVSLSRFRFFRRGWWLPVACLAGMTISGFAQPVFFAVKSTPYDRQMARVQPVLLAPPHDSVGRIQLAQLNRWMSSLRDMPYRYSKRWKTPAEVNSAKVADCKGKAVALYEKLRANGAHKVRVVIGKHRAEDLLTHAWVEWETKSGTYLLDPTFESNLAPVAQYPSTYIPFYAYEGAQKYRAATAMFVGGAAMKTAQPAPALNVSRPSVRSGNAYRRTVYSYRRHY
jgi:predicted transglutaminase-like cysteine proteinase